MWGATGRASRIHDFRNISIHAPRVGSDRWSITKPEQSRHFNPRSPCGERRVGVPILIGRRNISIHAPRVGSDDTIRLRSFRINEISIHAPRVGSDENALCVTFAVNVFQSTLPVWGATDSWEEKREAQKISIHAPRVGSDCSEILFAMHR